MLIEVWTPPSVTERMIGYLRVPDTWSPAEFGREGLLIKVSVPDLTPQDPHRHLSAAAAEIAITLTLAKRVEQNGWVERHFLRTAAPPDHLRWCRQFMTADRRIESAPP